MRGLFAALLTVALAGQAQAASPLAALQLPGFVPKTVTVSQGEHVLAMVLHARNAVAGLPEQTLDPLPCRSGSLRLGTLPNSPFRRVRASLGQQGWSLVKAVPGRGGREVAFQVRRGPITALGLWTTAPAFQTAVLLLCEQAAVWKPEPPARAPARSAPLGAGVAFAVPGWTGGAQALRAVAVTGKQVGVGTISATGQVRLPLAPPRGPLLPMTKWRQATELLGCADGKPYRGSVSASNPAVTFTAVRKLVTGDGSALTTPVMNAAVTRILGTPLIYTSAPVRLTGRLTCGDGDRAVTVDLNLPGGWAAVTHDVALPDFGKTTERVTNFMGLWSWAASEE